MIRALCPFPIGQNKSIILVENFSAPRGNAWQATSMYNTSYMNQILNPTQGDDWRNFMNQFAYINADMRIS